MSRFVYSDMDNTLTINMIGLGMSAGSYFDFDIISEAPPALTASVPEAPTLAMLGLGLLMMGFRKLKIR